jgi:uncharacterized protein (TIGR02118 family)
MIGLSFCKICVLPNLIKNEGKKKKMLKMIYCVKRRPDIDVDEFYRYWLEEHGPLVKKHAKALKIKKYVQCHTIQDTGEIPLNKMIRDSRGAIEAYDGVAELWWDSIDDFVAATSTPDGADAGQILLEDEQNFIDLSRSCIFFSEEHTIIED